MSTQSSLKFFRHVADSITRLLCPMKEPRRQQPSSCFKRYGIRMRRQDFRLGNFKTQAYGFASN
jgi:hypothetical protein